MDVALYIFIGVVLLALAFIYNRIIRYKNNAEDAWSNIDVFLKKRYELVPLLVSTVKAFAMHEEKTMTQVASARSGAMKASNETPSLREKVENELTSSINRVLFLQEAYPDLKANDSFLKLQMQLADIEQDLERARRYYNATVRENNTFGSSFPVNLFSKIMGYRKLEFFSISGNEAEVQEIEM